MASKPSYEDLEKRIHELENENAKLKRVREEDTRKTINKVLPLGGEDLYKTIFEHSGFGITLTDLRTAKIIAFNKKAYEDLGYTCEEFESLDSRSYLLTDEETFSEHLEAVIEKGWGILELRLKTKSGEIRDFIYSAVVVSIEGKKYIQGIRIDVTEQKQVERRLSESEEKYRNILENMEEAYYEIDLAGNFTFFNEAMIRHSGRSRDELMGMNTRDYTSPEEADRLSRVYNDVYTTGTPSRMIDLEVIIKDGSRRILESSASLIRSATGEPIGFRGISRDVTEQKKAEIALRESEKKYRNILETMDEGYYEVDRDGNFLYVNNALCEIHGYTRDEILRMNSRIYTPAEEIDKIGRIYREIWRTGSPAKIVDRTVIRKDGSVRMVETSASLLLDAARERIGFRGTSRDVTEHRKAEIALRESEEKYRNILDTMEEGYLETDLAGNTTFINDAMCKIHGYSRDEFMGMNNRDYTSPEVAQRVYRIFKEVYRTGIPAQVIEYEIIRKDGSIRKAESSASLRRNAQGEPIGFRGIIRDVTEHKVREIALKESEEKYRLLVENANDSIFISQDGFMKFFNPKTMMLTGYSEAELTQMPIIDLVHPEDRDGINERERKRRRGEPLQSNYAFRIINKEKQPLWVESSTIQIKWEEKPATLIIFRDITLQKQMETRLEHANKMEAIGTLAGGIAHDFNNLLMGVQGNASLILLGIDSNHPHHDRLRNIEQLVQAGSDLTRQLLGVAKGGKYEVKTTDLNALIEASANLFGRTRKEINIHKKFQEDIWPVDVDRRQIEQVLLNLNVNAWHAMPGGGDLYIETKNVNLDEYYTQPYGIAPGRYVRISVTDTGVGMDEITLKRIFDPFFTTKEMGRGTGLGLASAYGIIKNHNGIINAYSEKGEGSTFNIYLPVSDKKIMPETESNAQIHQGIETLLFIDDEEIIIEVGNAILKKLGYQVITARSGGEAVEIFGKQWNKIDLVILDMIMPGLGGGETFDRLKAIDPSVKVLLSSGYSINGQAQDILDRGCKGFMQKPFNIIELSKKLRQILDISN